MKNKRGISMISIVITIILIIILASISAVYLTTVMDDASEKTIREDIKNVETVVEYAKAQILAGNFTPYSGYQITETEIEDKFGKSLTEEEKNHIKTVNANTTVSAGKKYYLMKQSRFDEELKDGVNISHLNANREFLVQYERGLVACSTGDKLITNKPILLDGSFEIENGDVSVQFTPNGNTTWAKEQTCEVSWNIQNGSLESAKYVWSQSYLEPDAASFESAQVLTNGQEVTLKEKTGNNWYLWVRIDYRVNGTLKHFTTRSEAFAVDNLAPTGSLEVEEINK